MLVVSIGGSPSRRSRSGVLLERSQRWLQEQGVEVVSYQVRDFPAEDLLHARFDSPKVIDLLQQIENADGLLIATPVYNCLLYTSPSPRDLSTSRMPSSA